MSLVYWIMYRVGFMPWDTGEVPSELRAVVEGVDALDVGSALDIGCGTGTQSVYLAGRGWRVRGVDDLEQPLRRARARSADAGVAVDWVRADVTRLHGAGLKPGQSRRTPARTPRDRDYQSAAPREPDHDSLAPHRH